MRRGITDAGLRRIAQSFDSTDNGTNVRNQIEDLLSQEAPEELHSDVLDLLLPELERQIGDEMEGKRSDIDYWLYDVARVLKESEDRWGGREDYPDDPYTKRMEILRGYTGG
jgi:hypothetical protein